MAAQRGVAVNGFAPSSGTSTDYGYNEPNPYTDPVCLSPFCNNEIRATRAQLAGACVLLATAFVAGFMMLIKKCPWLANPSRRDKTRQGVFWTCIALVIVSRSISIADAAYRLENLGPSDWSVSSNSLIVALLDMFFSWMPDLLIFVLVLLENARTIEKLSRKMAIFEWANVAVIVILFVLIMAAWGLHARWVTSFMYESYDVVFQWNARRALLLTYAVIALLFALQMLGMSAFILMRQGMAKLRSVFLLVLSILICVNQAIQLAGVATVYFRERALAPHTATAFAITATRDFIISGELILIVLVVWQSYEFYSTNNRGYGSADADAITINQPSTDAQHLQNKKEGSTGSA